MIEMIKNGAISFHLKIDTLGIEEMIKYIEELENKNSDSLQVLYLGKKRSFEIELKDDVDKMLISEEFIKMYMDKEEIEFLNQRLKDALTSGCFYPSEVCERNYKNQYITVYCNVM